MTVAELIEKLKFMPQDMLVVIPGYEGGYDNPEIRSSTIVTDTNWNGTSKNHWYNGRHETYYEMESEGNVQPVACIVVGRGV